MLQSQTRSFHRPSNKPRTIFPAASLIEALFTQLHKWSTFLLIPLTAARPRKHLILEQGLRNRGPKTKPPPLQVRTDANADCPSIGAIGVSLAMRTDRTTSAHRRKIRRCTTPSHQAPCPKSTPGEQSKLLAPPGRRSNHQSLLSETRWQRSSLPRRPWPTSKAVTRSG